MVGVLTTGCADFGAASATVGFAAAFGSALGMTTAGVVGVTGFACGAGVVCFTGAAGAVFCFAGATAAGWTAAVAGGVV